MSGGSRPEAVPPARTGCRTGGELYRSPAAAVQPGRGGAGPPLGVRVALAPRPGCRPLTWEDALFTTRPELAGTHGMVASTHWLASAIPLAEASQCVEATMPWVPASSGRVVNSASSQVRGRQPGRGARATLTPSGGPAPPRPGWTAAAGLR